MAVIAIDPGLTGALALFEVDNERPFGTYDLKIEVADMPVSVGSSKGTVKNEVDAAGLTNLLKRWLSTAGHVSAVVVERVAAMPGQGVASMLSLGDSRGVVRGVVQALGLRMVDVTPQKWKKGMGLIGKDKDASRTLALRLYPRLADKLARKKDHGRADATMLGQYFLTQQEGY